MDLIVQAWPAGWELLDCGDGRKLERFGGVVLDRPAPQAIWPALRADLWGAAQAVFQRGEGGNGEWQQGTAPAPESWSAGWSGLTFELRLTGFGNIGLFPEHTGHWQWICDLVSERLAAVGPQSAVQVLNLFAYTGGASLAAARAGAAVTHVDAARAVNNWCGVNLARSPVEPDRLRFITDDALKYVRREARRGRRYHVIVLDPPTFGRGPKGEVWKIERDLHPLLAACADVLAPDAMGLLLTAHSPGLTPAVLRNMLAPLGGAASGGEMLLAGSEGAPALPAGTYARWTP